MAQEQSESKAIRKRRKEVTGKSDRESGRSTGMTDVILYFLAVLRWHSVAYGRRTTSLIPMSSASPLGRIRPTESARELTRAPAQHHSHFGLISRSCSRFQDLSIICRKTQQLAIMIHESFRSVDMQYLSLLRQSAMPAPVVEYSAHRKWADISQRCKLLIGDLKIDAFRTNMSLRQADERFGYAIFGRAAQYSRVSLCACAQVIQNDADCVARKLRVQQREPSNVGVTPRNDLAIRNGISTADIRHRIRSERPEPERVSRTKPIEDNLLPISG